MRARSRLTPQAETHVLAATVCQYSRVQRSIVHEWRTSVRAYWLFVTKPMLAHHRRASETSHQPYFYAAAAAAGARQHTGGCLAADRLLAHPSCRFARSSHSTQRVRAPVPDTARCAGTEAARTRPSTSATLAGPRLAPWRMSGPAPSAAFRTMRPRLVARTIGFADSIQCIATKPRACGQDLGAVHVHCRTPLQPLAMPAEG